MCNALDHVRSGSGPAIVHGNGYYLTKHAVGVYSAEPPELTQPPDTQPRTPGQGRPREHRRSRSIPTCSGPVRIVAWTVPYGRDGSAEPGIVIAETAEGTRTIARADSELTTLPARPPQDRESGRRDGRKFVTDQSGGSRTMTAL